MPRQTIMRPVRRAPATEGAGDWRHSAVCRDVDPDLFFPVGDEGDLVAAQVADAKRVCGGCPAVTRCLDWALSTGQDEGVWGGTTPAERRALRRSPRLRQLLEVA